jgi:hypothetical protein
LVIEHYQCGSVVHLLEISYISLLTPIPIWLLQEMLTWFKTLLRKTDTLNGSMSISATAKSIDRLMFTSNGNPMKTHLPMTMSTITTLEDSPSIMEEILTIQDSTDISPTSTSMPERELT